jgi:hypothetical protein
MQAQLGRRLENGDAHFANENAARCTSPPAAGQYLLEHEWRNNRPTVATLPKRNVNRFTTYIPDPARTLRSKQSAGNRER